MRCYDASIKAICGLSLEPRDYIKPFILKRSYDYVCVKAKAYYVRCTRYSADNKPC